MKETDVQILCGCDATTWCPQGKTGAGRQCVVVVPEDDLFRIVRKCRRYIVIGQEEKSIDSASDERVGNNVMRHGYRVLSDEEKHQMKTIKDHGLMFHEYLNAISPPSRELSLAKTKIEEAVMWAVKHVTG